MSIEYPITINNLQNANGKCLICGTIVKNYITEDSNRTQLTFGHGSLHHTDVYNIYICDNCVTRKIKEGLLKPIRINLETQ